MTNLNYSNYLIKKDFNIEKEYLNDLKIITKFEKPNDTFLQYKTASLEITCAEKSIVHSSPKKPIAIELRISDYS